MAGRIIGWRPAPDAAPPLEPPPCHPSNDQATSHPDNGEHHPSGSGSGLTRYSFAAGGTCQRVGGGNGHLFARYATTERLDLVRAAAAFARSRLWLQAQCALRCAGCSYAACR